MNDMIDGSQESQETPEYMLLPRRIFKLSLNEYRDNDELKNELLEAIERNEMASCYEEVCEAFNWPLDEELYNKMQRANATAWESLESPPFDTDFDTHAKKNWREKLEYALKSGNYNRAYEIAHSVYSDETISSSGRVEAAFNVFRISYLQTDVSGMGQAVEDIKILMDATCRSGSDWCCRNKLKVYEAVYCLAIRNFSKATTLLLDCVPTFESYELLTFKHLIRYTVLSGMLTLQRSEIAAQFCKNGNLQQALTTECPDYNEYISSLFDCHYASFFKNLAWIERKIKTDPLLRPHYRHYVREMRIRAYSQILQAYRTLSLTRMATEFGVSEEYIEQEVASFIASRRLHCKIDKLAEVILTMNATGCDSGQAPDICCDREYVYKCTMKKGDALLNRLKKLAQVIDL